jgi:type I restriction enzyme R subunit
MLTDEPATSSALGKADFILYSIDGRPLAIIEAKRAAIDPYRAKQQALAYARAVGAPFIFLSNGEVIYFWDYLEGDARPVASFFSQRDLERIVHQRKNRKDLGLVPMIEDSTRPRNGFPHPLIPLHFSISVFQLFSIYPMNSDIRQKLD